MPESKESKFNLGSYVEVKDRVAKFYELFGNGRLVTDEVLLTSEPDGKPRVMVKALAYRNPDDEHPAVGYSWMELPGTTSYTRGSELENTETSAIGRAIGFLGILIDRSIASAQEVDSKSPGGGLVDKSEPTEPFESSVEGKMTAGSPPVDLGFRQTPNGLLFGFVLEAEGRKRLKVIATGGLAEALQFVKADGMRGTWVTAHGLIERIPWKKGDRDMPPYQQMTLARLETPEWTLPAPAAVPLVDEADLDRALELVP